ncbi:MAG: hypothetical protein AB7I50_03840, partial [Vicinamibacterales bacterium]
MKKLLLTGVALLCANAAFAVAPNRADTSQLGSVLGFPYVVANNNVKTTIIRLTNTGNAAVSVRCQFADDATNNVGIIYNVPSNGSQIFNMSDGSYPIGGEGFLFCWAVNANGNRGINWNFLAGTATILDSAGSNARWEYSAWAFAARKAGVANGAVVVPGAAGLRTIPLDGVNYDNCPEYLIGQYSPTTTTVTNTALVASSFSGGRFAAVPCNVDFTALTMPPLPVGGVKSTITLTLLNDQGVANTGVNVTCIGNWHEAALPI